MKEPTFVRFHTVRILLLGNFLAILIRIVIVLVCLENFNSHVNILNYFLEKL